MASLVNYIWRYQDLPFDGTGLFNSKTDEAMENFHKMCKSAKPYSSQQFSTYSGSNYRFNQPYSRLYSQYQY